MCLCVCECVCPLFAAHAPHSSHYLPVCLASTAIQTSPGLGMELDQGRVDNQLASESTVSTPRANHASPESPASPASPAAPKTSLTTDDIPSKKAMDHDSLVTVRLSEPPNLAVNTDAASNALPSWKSLHGRDLTPTDTMADVAQEETDEEEDEDAITPQPTVLEYGQDLHDDLAMEPNEVDEYGEEQQAPPNHGLHTARNSAAHSSSTRQSVESEAVDWDRLQETEEAELKDQDTDHAGVSYAVRPVDILPESR